MAPNHDRSMLELAVQDRLSLLLIAATSYTDPEFGRVCARIRELCKEVDNHTLMVPALWRLALNQFMQSEIEAGLALSDDLLDARGRQHRRGADRRRHRPRADDARAG